MEMIDPFLSEHDFAINTVMSSDIKKKLAKAIDKLTKRQKEIIFLKFYSGLSYEEISEVTSIKNQSIRNITSNALKKLRILLPKSVVEK
jgi:RNA polymerase sigma-70 factor (ECF subfamily)